VSRGQLKHVLMIVLGLSIDLPLFLIPLGELGFKHQLLQSDPQHRKPRDAGFSAGFQWRAAREAKKPAAFQVSSDVI